MAEEIKKKAVAAGKPKEVKETKENKEQQKQVKVLHDQKQVSGLVLLSGELYGQCVHIAETAQKQQPKARV